MSSDSIIDSESEGHIEKNELTPNWEDAFSDDEDKESVPCKYSSQNIGKGNHSDYSSNSKYQVKVQGKGHGNYEKKTSHAAGVIGAQGELSHPSTQSEGLVGSAVHPTKKKMGQKKYW